MIQRHYSVLLKCIPLFLLAYYAHRRAKTRDLHILFESYILLLKDIKQGRKDKGMEAEVLIFFFSL